MSYDAKLELVGEKCQKSQKRVFWSRIPLPTQRLELLIKDLETSPKTTPKPTQDWNFSWRTFCV